MSLKNPVIPPGINPGTVRLVAQRLNHYVTPGPSIMMGTLHKYLCIFMTNISLISTSNEKFFRQKMHKRPKHTFFYLLALFFFENPAVCGIMWINIVEPERPQMTIWRMRIACRITKAKNTHTEYVILIACTLQQWLHNAPHC